MDRIHPSFDTTSDDIHRYNFALSTFRHLGQYAAETVRSGRVTLTMKPDGTPVTNIDIEIENQFTEAVEKQYGSEDIVLGEETMDPSKEIPSNKRIWRLDPLDGTGWLQRLLEAGQTDYSTLRSLLLTAHFKPDETTPVFSVIHSPFYGEKDMSISAISGKTYYHHDDVKHQVYINPNAPTDLAAVTRYEKNGLAWATQDVSEQKLQEIMPLARRVKLPLFMGNIALHNVDVSVFPGPSQPHDIAAGAHAVVNAGGSVKDFDGSSYEEIDWRKFPINGVVAGSNESLVDQVVVHYSKRL